MFDKFKYELEKNGSNYASPREAGQAIAAILKSQRLRLFRKYKELERFVDDNLAKNVIRRNM